MEGTRRAAHRRRVDDQAALPRARARDAPGQELDCVADETTRAFRRVANAYEALTDPEYAKRKQRKRAQQAQRSAYKSMRYAQQQRNARESECIRRLVPVRVHSGVDWASPRRLQHSRRRRRRLGTCLVVVLMSSIWTAQARVLHTRS